MRTLITLIVFLLMVVSCGAQELKVDIVYADALTITTPSKTIETQVEGVVISKVTSQGVVTTSKQKVALLKIETLATAIRCKSKTTDIDKIDPKTFLISTPGKHQIDVLAIGLIDGNLFFDEQTVQVELGQGPNPPPVPPGPTPDVDNTYGLGKIAYEKSPQDITGAAYYADIWQRAGEFLYGRPSIKVIAEDDNPNSVFLWVRNQLEAYPCPDPETCKQWTQWRADIAEAFILSQQARQYSRETWYAAFNEIANALKVKK